ncbi:hypothetical protein Bbelb_322530 [Branchiostoma belcheri]|nr:hypothetical protein Bbelb_322530 [Branchiostoma belcheri]
MTQRPTGGYETARRGLRGPRGDSLLMSEGVPQALGSPISRVGGQHNNSSGADIRGIFLTASGVVVLLILLLVAKQFCGKRALMGRTFWFYGVPQPTPSLFGPRLQRPLPQIYRLHKLPKTQRLNSKQRGHSLRRPHPYWKPQTLHVSHLQSLDARLRALSRASKRSSAGPNRIGLQRYLPGMSTLNQQVFSHSFLVSGRSSSFERTFLQNRYTSPRDWIFRRHPRRPVEWAVDPTKCFLVHLNYNIQSPEASSSMANSVSSEDLEECTLKTGGTSAHLEECTLKPGGMSDFGKKASQSVSTIHPQAPDSIEPPSTVDIPSIHFSDSDDTDTVSVDFWPPPPDETDYWPLDIEELDDHRESVSNRLQNQDSPRLDRSAISLAEFLKTGETIETNRSYITRL